MPHAPHPAASKDAAAGFAFSLKGGPPALPIKNGEKMSSLKLRHSLVLGGSMLVLSTIGLAQTAKAQEASTAAALQAQAVLSGNIYDEAGSALPGARVIIPELGVETTTDLQGGFVLTAPESGNVTVEVRYLGRPAFNQPVTLSGRSTSLNLVVPRGEESDIVVTAASIVDNTARALNQQRQAINTTNVVSSDAIGRFPDPNIAEALQRVAGIGIERDQGEGRYINVRGAPADFTAVSIDGVTVTAPSPTTRAIDLDTIPSDIVANLEVSKSLLPYQDADSIAGAVNIATRSAFDSRGFRLSASAGLSHNQMGGTSDRRAALSVSNRFGAEKQFGVLLSGSYSRTDRKLDNVENAWASIGNSLYGVTETLFKDYDTKRERIAATGALEWRPAPGSRLYLRGSYSRFEDNEFRNRLSILWTEGTLQPGATNTSATYTNTRIEKQVRHRVQRNEIYTATAGGEHRLGGGKIEYSGTYTKSEQTYPRRDELLFRSTLRPRQSYDFANPDNPDYSLFTTGEHLQVDRFAFRENAYRANDTFNDEWTFQTKVEFPSTFAGVPVTYSFGGRYRDRNVTANEERFRDRRASAAPTATLASFLTDIESTNFDYLLGNKFNPTLADQYFDLTRPTSERRMPQSITADYTGSEKILGIFGMGQFDLGSTLVVAGVRYETTDFRGAAPTFNESTSAIGEAVAKSRYGRWFPNLTVRHNFTDNLIGRFALTRAINRPNFVDLVPRVVENTDSAIVRVTSGNPLLRPTLSNNVDAGLEYYLQPLGMISVNGFYKDLKDYRYTVTRNGTYLGAAAELTRPENAPEGHLYGVEVNWQQQFTFLPGLLSGFGVFANYTWTEAEVKLAQPYAGRQIMPLPGNSKHSWNAALFYERGPLNLRVSYTKRSDYLNEINANDANLDLYWEGRGQLDVTGSYQLLKNVGIFVEAKNLTNSPGVRYYGTRERVYEYEKFGYTLFGGVRVKF